MNFSRVIALDVGSRLIGAAQTCNGSFIETLPALERSRKRGEKNVLALIEAESIECLAVGIPLLEGNKFGEQGMDVLQFCRRLRRRTSIPIILVDESQSSLEAADRLKIRSREDRESKKRSGMIDSEAAKIILARFLDRGLGYQTYPLEKFDGV